MKAQPAVNDRPASRLRGPISWTFGLIILLGFLTAAQAQMGFGRGPGRRQRTNLVPEFDVDGDGRLSDQERQAARQSVRSRAAGRPLGSSPGIVAPTAPDLEHELSASSAAAPPPGIGLYDESTLRTLYLRFANQDWFAELSDL